MRERLIIVLLTVAVTAAVLGTGATFGAFTSQADSPGNRVVGADDWLAPTVGTSVIAKTAGGTPGFVRQGGTYYVYANVSDAGNPASGVGAVTADVSQVTTDQTAVALVAGSYSIGGTSYDYRSAQLTADGSLSAGTKGYSVSATDNDSNGPAQAGFTVTVDNTPPSGADIQTANHASTVGLAQASDTITYSFSEPIDPNSVVAGWDGSATNVVVRLINGGLLPAAADTVQIFNAANSSALPLGTVNLGSGLYVGGLAGGDTALFGATGTASTMVMSGSTITVTLGTASGQAATQVALVTTSMTWTPSATATDRAGNACSTAVASESGAGDLEF